MGTLEHQVPGPSIFKVSLYAGVGHTRSPRVTQKNSRGQRSSKGHVWADSKSYHRAWSANGFCGGK
jgi:hypothetical protein